MISKESQSNNIFFGHELQKFENITTTPLPYLESYELIQKLKFICLCPISDYIVDLVINLYNNALATCREVKVKYIVNGTEISDINNKINELLVEKYLFQRSIKELTPILGPNKTNVLQYKNYNIPVILDIQDTDKINNPNLVEIIDKFSTEINKI